MSDLYDRGDDEQDPTGEIAPVEMQDGITDTASSGTGPTTNPDKTVLKRPIISAIASVNRVLGLAVLAVIITFALNIWLPLSRFAVYGALFVFILLLMYSTGRRRVLLEVRYIPPGNWRWYVSPLYGWTSERAFDRVRYVLSDAKRGENEPEDEVLLFTRYHWLKLARWLVPAIIGSLAVVSLPLYGPHEIETRLNLRVSIPASTVVAETTTTAVKPVVTAPEWLRDLRPSLPETIRLPLWWAYLLLDLAAAILLLRLVMDWYYSYIMITNKNFHHLRVPPSWLPWMHAPTPALPLFRIGIYKNVDTSIGNQLGYGGIHIGTNMQEKEDKQYDHIKYVPKHNNVLKILDYVVPSHSAA